MKIKWGNLLAVLLIVGGAAGYFKWPELQSQWDRYRTESIISGSKDSVIYARDSWITGGIPELGLSRGYHRDVNLKRLEQLYYASDVDRLASVSAGKAHVTEISWPSLLYNLEKGRHQEKVAVLAFIDYSRGADGLIVKNEINTVNELVGKRVGYVGDGTGKYLLSFLLRMVDYRFEDVKSSPYDDEAVMVADFLAGKLDAIAFWQPGMSEVLQKLPGSRVLLSTADMPSLIPDVLVANRQWLAENPEKAEAFLRFWFMSVKHLQERPDQAYATWTDALNRATYAEGGVQEPIYGENNKPDELREMFTKEVRLIGFEENLKLMGVTARPEWDQLVKFAVENWNRVDDLKGPTAQNLISNRTLDALKADVTLQAGVIDPSKSGNARQEPEKPKEFAQGADPGKLDEVAQMAIPNIEFEPDATAITPVGRKVITDVVVPLLQQFPNFYLMIDGHTDVGGDDGVLTRLSQGRSASVKLELVKLGFADAQLITRGFGDRQPLYPMPKTDLEKAKNRRTEFRLLREPAAR